MDDRKRELLSIVEKFGTDAMIEAQQLIDEIVFLEDKLKETKKLPFMVVNPKNPTQQKKTAAFMVYKELLIQFNACLRNLLKIAGDTGDNKEETSYLRQWVKQRGGLYDLDARQ